MDSYDILVIFLSVALAVLLVLSIVFVAYLIKVIKRINNIAVQAEKVVDNVQTASKIFEKSAVPVAFSRIVANVVDSFTSSKDKKKK